MEILPHFVSVSLVRACNHFCTPFQAFNQYFGEIVYRLFISLVNHPFIHTAFFAVVSAVDAGTADILNPSSSQIDLVASLSTVVSLFSVKKGQENFT